MNLFRVRKDASVFQLKAFERVKLGVVKIHL